MSLQANLQTIGSGYNLNKINSNFEAIQTALEKGLGRDGLTPNSMEADFDLNSNDLLNGGVAYFDQIFVDGVDVTTIPGEQGPTGPQGPPGNDGVMQSVVAGTGISIDATDPANPIITNTGAVSDGDKGDITVSASGTTWTIDNGLAATKIANGSVSNTEFQYLDGVTSAIQTQLDAKQTLDSDLTSWAAITRASGFDTFVATPSSTNLASLLTDETGTGTVVFTSSIREKLTANRTYYVRTDGSDSNDGLANTSGGAFLTIQKAIDVAAGLDSAIYDVTISVAAGTYGSDGIVCKQMGGAGRVLIVGDETTPANVALSITLSAFSNGFSTVLNPTIYEVRGVNIARVSGGTTSAALNAESGLIRFQNVEFGANWVFHLRAQVGGKIEATGNYTIAASAATSHWRAQTGQIAVLSRTVTLVGTPSFTTFANCNIGGTMLVNGNTFSGSATGSYYTVSLNGVIQTNGGGATYLPGNSAGSSATGGQYA